MTLGLQVKTQKENKTKQNKETKKKKLSKQRQFELQLNSTLNNPDKRRPITRLKGKLRLSGSYFLVPWTITVVIPKSS